MLYIEKDGLKISRLGLGTWAMGAGKDWGPSDKNENIKTIHAALACGINLIDTAPIYGNYRAEELVGDALKGRRQQAVLATKCGLTPAQRAVKFDLSPKAVRAEIENSLTRLKTDYIDIYLTHWPDRNTPLNETLGELKKLKEEGKIRFYGVCNLDETALEKAAETNDISFVQNEYSFLKRNESVLDFCKRKNKIFMAYGTLGGGILGGGYKKEPCLPRYDVRSFFYKYYKGDAFKKSLEAVEILRQTAKEHSAETAQTALAFVLARYPLATALFGARSPHRVEQNAKAADLKFTSQDWDLINERYA